MTSTSKVILITGASMGIRQATAQLLAEQGYRVFGTSRHPAHAENYEMLVLDVRSDESVQNCVQTVIERAGCIDVLINNAGLEFLGAPMQRLYAASKQAIEGYSESLWYEVEPFNIRISLVQAGFINSRFVHRRESPDPLPAYDSMRDKLLPAWLGMAEHAPSPMLVAHTMQRIIESEYPRLRYVVGLDSLGSWLSYRLLSFEPHAEIIRLFHHVGNPARLVQKLISPMSIFFRVGMAVEKIY